MSDISSSETSEAEAPDEGHLERERSELLQRLEDWLETPMLILAFVWLAILIVELTQGESPLFEFLGALIWGVFILDFTVKLLLAPQKVAYLKNNWLTAISLLVPALRVFRAFRLFRVLQLAPAGRSLRLVRVVGSLNRGMKALGASLSRRGFGYILALTVLVMLGGSAGMYAFEKEAAGGFRTYGDALWWTAMIMTTMGSQYWPQTVEGRILCFSLAIYAFAMFGYVTAALATFFVGRDAESDDAELAGAKQLAALRVEVRALREDIVAMTREPPAL
jgi:voltage-gated potassium channel